MALVTNRKLSIMMDFIKKHKIAVIIIIIVLIIVGLVLSTQNEEPTPITIDDHDTDTVVVKPGQSSETPTEASPEDDNSAEAKAAAETIQSIPGYSAFIVRSARVAMQNGEYKLVYLTIYDSVNDSTFIDPVITKNDRIVSAIPGMIIESEASLDEGIPEEILNAYWESMDNGQ